jgi:hypothetical protein
VTAQPIALDATSPTPDGREISLSIPTPERAHVSVEPLDGNGRSTGIFAGEATASGDCCPAVLLRVSGDRLVDDG